MFNFLKIHKYGNNNFWHIHNDIMPLKFAISDFDCSFDGEIFKITEKNGSQRRPYLCSNVFIYDHTTGSGTAENYPDPMDLRDRLVSLQYTPYLNSGGSGGASNLNYNATPTNGIITNSNGTGVTIPIADATNAGLLSPAKFTVLQNQSNTNTGDETAPRIAAIHHAANEKTTLVDGDEISGQNSQFGYALIRFTLLNLYNYLKTKFDSVYTTSSAVATQISTALSSYATTSYVDSSISSATVGLLNDRGNFTPSGNYPSSGGSGTSGAIRKGDLWTISGLGSGVSATMGTKTVTDGDVVRALTNTPGQTNSNWAIGENNFGYVAENLNNKTSTITGNETSTTLYSSIKGIVDWLTAAKIRSILGVTTLSGSNTGDQDLSGLAVKANNLSDLTNQATARVNLEIDKKTTFGNSNYTALATDKIIATSVTLTANRTITLPTGLAAGKEITIIDEAGVIGTYTIIIAPPTGKKLNGSVGATEIIKATYGSRKLIADGSDNFTFDAGQARLTGATFTGAITAPNLLNTNTGDENDYKFRILGYTKFLDFISSTVLGEFSNILYGGGNHQSGSGSGGVIYPVGVTRFRTSSAAVGGGGIAFPNNTTLGFYLLAGMGVDYCFYLPNLSSTNTTRIGLNAYASAAGDYTDGVYLEINGGTIYGKTARVSVRSQTASSYSSLVADTLYHCRLRVISTTLIQYYLFDASGNLLWSDSLSTNTPVTPPSIPAVLLCAQILANNSAATIQDIIVNDYFSFTVPGFTRGALS